MKIALVSPYDFAYPGGVAQHICHLEQHFTRMGHDVKIIAPASKVVTNIGDKFIPIGKPRPIPASGSIARITLSPWLSSRIKPVLERENFEIIHLHEPLMPMLCTTVLRLSQTTNIATFHASGARPWYNYGTPIGKWFLWRWYHKINGKIAVSEMARQCVSKYFPSEYSIIPNGIDLDHFSPDVRPIEKFNDCKLNILFLGRLEKRKGLIYLLRAYKEVKQEVQNCRLIIVGPGTRLRRKFEKYVRQNNLKDVVFIGFVDYEDLPRYYKTADVYCAPATGCESFGIVLLEAMAVGTPVIASNVEGYAGLIGHGKEGLLVPPKDDKELARALILLLKDEALRKGMGNKGVFKASEYSWEDITRKLIDYYTEVREASLGKERFSKPVLV
jgi:phosphatidylinositol alpha-mannosyltransferase